MHLWQCFFVSRVNQRITYNVGLMVHLYYKYNVYYITRLNTIYVFRG